MSEPKEEPTSSSSEKAAETKTGSATAAQPSTAMTTSAAQADESAAQAGATPEATQDPGQDADAASSPPHASSDALPVDSPTGRTGRLSQFRNRFRRKDREKGAPRKRRRRLQPRPPTDFRRELTTIPNILTYIRIAMLPLILLALDRENRWSSFVSGCLFSAACFTDFFDGYFARKFNQVTVLGKLLDPLADKLIVSATLIVMIPMGRLPAWLVIVLLAREFAITGLRGIAASEGMVIASAPLAKFKTAFQMLAIFCLLIHYPYEINYFGLITLEASFHRMGLALIYLGLFFSLASAFDYFWKFAKAINQHYEESQEHESR